MKRIKLTIDLLMLAATLTLFNKNFLGMAYHEIAGLALVGLCAVHIAINLKTLAAMCRTFRRVSLSIRVGLAVDVLLILSYGFIGLSGVMISKTILTGVSARTVLFRVRHTFASACAVFLLGVHIGLHICRRPMRTALAAALTAALLCGGLFALLRTGELRWLAMPFAAAQTEGRGAELPEGFGSDGAQWGHGQGGPGKGLGRGEGRGAGGGFADRPDRTDEHAGAGHGTGRASVSEGLADAALFGCLILSCSMLTYWPVVLSKRRRARRADAAEPKRED